MAFCDGRQNGHGFFSDAGPQTYIIISSRCSQTVWWGVTTGKLTPGCHMSVPLELGCWGLAVHRRVHYAGLTASSRPGSSRGYDLRELRKASRERTVVSRTHLIGLPFAAPSTGCQVGFDDAARGELSSTISAWLLEWTRISEPFYRRGRLGSRPDVSRSLRSYCSKMRRAARCHRVGERGRGASVRWSFKGLEKSRWCARPCA